MAERRWFQRNAQALNPLVQHTVDAAVAREIGARQLANVAHAAARSGMGKSLNVLFVALSSASVQLVHELNPQELAKRWQMAGQGVHALGAAIAQLAQLRRTEPSAHEREPRARRLKLLETHTV